MPVSTGRVSSREAERATLSTVSTNAGPGTSTRPSPSGSGNGGKSSRRSVRMWNVAEPRDDLDVLLGGAQLERDLVAGQRADDVDEQPRRQDDGALADDLALERDAQADLHVGGAQLDRAALGEELDAGERLDGAAGGGGAGDGLQLGEERVAPGRELHAAACLSTSRSMMKEIQSSSGLLMVCTSLRNGRTLRERERAACA